MSKLEETMRVMHTLLRGEKTPDELADYFNADARRLAIYQNFVKGHITKTLDSHYLSLKTVFSEEIWDKIAEEYFCKYPAEDWRLYEATQYFSDFLAELKDRNLYSINDFHIELALFEKEEVKLYSIKEHILTGEEVEEPTINPSISILTFEYPIVKFVESQRKEINEGWLTNKEYLKKKEQPKTVFLFRLPGKKRKAVFYEATDTLLFSFKVVHDKMDMETIVQASGQDRETVKDVLKNAEDLGLIIAPKGAFD